MEATVAPVPETPRPDIHRPPEREPDREEKEYFEWRQELL